MYNYLGKSKKFDFITPEGRRVEGFISREHDFRLGTLLVKSVDGQESNQLIQGFPRIGYLDEPISGNVHIQNKFDGTNILYYPLIINEKIVEVIPKTRGTPIVEGKFLEYTQRIPNTIVDFVKNTGLSIPVEIYGYEINDYFINSYMTDYKTLNIPFAFSVIGILRPKELVNYTTTIKLAKKYGLPFTFKQFNINGNEAVVTKDFKTMYSDFLVEDIIIFDDLLDLYKKVEVFYQKMNENYWLELKNSEERIIIEGSVWRINNGKERIFKNKTPSEKISSTRELNKYSIRTYLRRCLEDLTYDEFLQKEICFGELIEHLKEECDPNSVRRNENILLEEYKRYCKLLSEYSDRTS